MPRITLLILLCLAVTAHTMAQNEDIVAKAYLEFKIFNPEVVVGECAIGRLAFYVADDNKMPIRFHDLQRQLLDISPSFVPEGTYVQPSRIVNINGVEAIVNNERYTRYDIYEGGVCPT